MLINLFKDYFLVKLMPKKEIQNQKPIRVKAHFRKIEDKQTLINILEKIYLKQKRHLLFV